MQDFETIRPNADHEAYWVSPAGLKWVTHQERLDRLFSEVNELLLRRADPTAGERVLDIGCGTGDLTLEAAGAVGAHGHVAGLDISAPLLDLARRRAAGRPGVSFILGDAQTHAFAPGTDLILSRFGVMFFDDPVAAFANMGRALRPGGRLIVAAWAPFAENPWSVISREAGIARLGPAPPSDPNAPGQFALADTAKVVGLLEAAGLNDVTGEIVDLHLHVEGNTAEAAALCTSIGPVARLMQAHGGSDADLAAITEAVAEVLAAYRSPVGVSVPARVTLYTARR